MISMKNPLHRTASLLLCLGLCTAVLPGCSSASPSGPDPKPVQVVNPIVTVSSVTEMEAMLDFSVPILDRDVETYIVLVYDGYPQMGRISYTDGSVFSVKYGQEDVSGIYGGTLDASETLNGVQVDFYHYEDTSYARWEKDGFSFSLTGKETLHKDIATLIG